jgi:hypothetical protein
VQQRLSHSLAIWVAWVLAGVGGSLLPILLNAFILPWIQARSLYDYEAAVWVVVSAICLAFFQYIVLRVLLARVSLTVVMWIPASAIAALVAFNTPGFLQGTVLRTLISISAISASLPQGFPLIQVILALIGFAFAAFLGLGQGIVLSMVYRRGVVGFWVLANLLAALVVGIVLGVRYQEFVSPDFIDTLLGGVVYAAVTGPALLLVAGRRLGGDTSRALPPSAHVGI